MRLRLREPLLYRWLRIKRAFDQRPRPAGELGTPAIQRILAISCTALGDTLLSTPALGALRETYPQAHITLLVHPALQVLFTGRARPLIERPLDAQPAIKQRFPQAQTHFSGLSCPA